MPVKNLYIYIASKNRAVITETSENIPAAIQYFEILLFC